MELSSAGEMSDTSAAHEVCPYIGRRLPRELYVKIFVVHFTTITAYAHLQHFRNERRSLLRYVFVVLCPFPVALGLIIPVLVALIETIVRRKPHAI